MLAKDFRLDFLLQNAKMREDIIVLKKNAFA